MAPTKSERLATDTKLLVAPAVGGGTIGVVLPGFATRRLALHDCYTSGENTWLGAVGGVVCVVVESLPVNSSKCCSFEPDIEPGADELTMLMQSRS